MAGEERRPSTVMPVSPFIEVTDAASTSLQADAESKAQPEPEKRTPSPEIPAAGDVLPRKHRIRTLTETQYADTEVEELMAMLRETESLEEQGDILQYLVSSLSEKSIWRYFIKNLELHFHNW